MHNFGDRSRPQGLLPEREWQALRARWRQVHGTAIGELREAAQDLGDVDGVWTARPGLPIAVVSADCVPILLERKDARAVAALHAGWRGTEARITEKFFSSIPDPLSDPSEWIARIGPSIRACCYQVGSDLIERFVKAFPEVPRLRIEPGSRMLDLVEVNRALLQGLGVSVDFIHPDCTSCAKSNGTHRYFSYRRGDRESRQFSMISIQSK